MLVFALYCCLLPRMSKTQHLYFGVTLKLDRETLVVAYCVHMRSAHFGSLSVWPIV